MTKELFLFWFSGCSLLVCAWWIFVSLPTAKRERDFWKLKADQFRHAAESFKKLYEDEKQIRRTLERNTPDK